jgi:hypothetical protein
VARGELIKPVDGDEAQSAAVEPVGCNFRDAAVIRQDAALAG